MRTIPGLVTVIQARTRSSRLPGKTLLPLAGSTVLNDQNNKSLFLLTVVTVLTLPFNVIGGLFGMNVGDFPFADHSHGLGMVVALVVSFTVPAGILALGGVEHSLVVDPRETSGVRRTFGREANRVDGLTVDGSNTQAAGRRPVARHDGRDPRETGAPPAFTAARRQRCLPKSRTRRRP